MFDFLIFDLYFDFDFVNSFLHRSVGDGMVPGVGAKVPGYDGVKEPYGVNDIPGTPIEQKF